MKCAIFIFFVANLALATSRPKGTSTCQGDACLYFDLPLGVEAFGSPEPKPASENGTSTASHGPSQAKPLTGEQVPRTPRKRLSDRGRLRSDGNLPAYYAGIDRSRYEASEKVVYVPKGSPAKLKALSSGDVIRAVIEQSIKASPSVPTPVRALITSGPMKGSHFLGEATLDGELKRVLLIFYKLKVSHALYEVKAKGLSLSGQIGLEGEYHSDTGKFFLAELASSAAAGMADSTIQRNQTSNGNWVEAPSLANSAKHGLVTALSRTADRTAEAVRSAPEFTETKQFQEILVFIEEDPTGKEE